MCIRDSLYPSITTGRDPRFSEFDLRQIMTDTVTVSGRPLSLSSRKGQTIRRQITGQADLVMSLRLLLFIRELRDPTEKPRRSSDGVS